MHVNLGRKGKDKFRYIKMIDKNKLIDEVDKKENNKNWSGFGIYDFIKSYDEFIKTFDLIYNNDMMKNATLNMAIHLDAHMDRLYGLLNLFIKDKSQKNFEQIFSSVESLRL